jgi:hypothetical protein
LADELVESVGVAIGGTAASGPSPVFVPPGTMPLQSDKYSFQVRLEKVVDNTRFHKTNPTRAKQLEREASRVGGSVSKPRKKVLGFVPLDLRCGFAQQALNSEGQVARPDAGSKVNILALAGSVLIACGRQSAEELVAPTRRLGRIPVRHQKMR